MFSTVSAARPWYGLASLVIAVWLLFAIFFLSTPEGQHAVEEFAQPLGYAAILLGVVGPMMFLAAAGSVVFLALGAIVRREPLRIGDAAVMIVLALFLQAASARADLWAGFPLRLAAAGAVAFGVGACIWWVSRRFGQTRP